MKQIIFLTIALTALLSVSCTRNLPASTPTSTPGLSAEAEVTEQTESVSTEQTTDTGSNERAFEDGVPLAARVNDEPILLETYQKQIGQFEQTLIEQGIDPTDEKGQTAISQMEQQVLDALVDQALIEQEADRLGVTISEATLESKIQESIEQGQGQEQFEAWLVANDLTLPEFKETLRFQLIANQMFEQVTAEVADTAEQIQLRQILVSDEATAREIINQLKTGVDFTELVATYSLDESNRESGGSLGWFPRGAKLVPPEIEEVAFSLEVNEVSGPIKTLLGYHIIQLENKEADRPLAPEMAPVLKGQQFSQWLMEQRVASVIEKFVGA